MSDAGVRAAVEDLEAWLSDPAFAWDPQRLEAWNRTFRTAVEDAQRGPGWEALVARAHALGERLASLSAPLKVDLEATRRELDGQQRGGRALRSYLASTR